MDQLVEHHKKIHKSTECPKCKIVFPTRNETKKHYLKEHKKQKNSIEIKNVSQIQIKIKKDSENGNQKELPKNEDEIKDQSLNSNQKIFPKNEDQIKKEQKSENKVELKQDKNISNYNLKKVKNEVNKEKANIDLVKQIMANNNKSWPQLVVLPLNLEDYTSKLNRVGTIEKIVKQSKWKSRSITDFSEPKPSIPKTKSHKRRSFSVSNTPVNGDLENSGIENEDSPSKKLKIIKCSRQLSGLPEIHSGKPDLELQRLTPMATGQCQSETEARPRLESEMKQPDMSMDEIMSSMSTSSNWTSSSISKVQDFEGINTDFFEMPEIDFLPAEFENDKSEIIATTDNQIESSPKRNLQTEGREAMMSKSASYKDLYEYKSHQLQVALSQILKTCKQPSPLETNIIETSHFAIGEPVSCSQKSYSEDKNNSQILEHQPTLEHLRQTLNLIFWNDCQNNKETTVKDKAPQIGSKLSTETKELICDNPNLNESTLSDQTSGQSSMHNLATMGMFGSSASQMQNVSQSASPDSARSSGYQSTSSETQNVTINDPGNGRQIDKLTRTVHSSMTTMRPFGSVSKTFSDHERRDEEKTSSSITKRKGLANFKFRSLSNKLVR